MEELLEALAQPERFAFVEFLVLREEGVTQAEYLKRAGWPAKKRGTLSHHVADLVKAGLVRNVDGVIDLVERDRVRAVLLALADLDDIYARDRAKRAKDRAAALRRRQMTDASRRNEQRP